jgi:hypothetical protein
MRLWNAAEEESVRVFAANLRDLPLAAPPAPAPPWASIPATVPASVAWRRCPAVVATR